MVQYEFEERSFSASGAVNDYSHRASGGFHNDWAAENLPLVRSKLCGFHGDSYATNEGAGEPDGLTISSRSSCRRKVILINLVSLLVNLLLATIGFYLSFTENSTASSAFGADCVLDLLSSAILLWRYHGHLASLYMEAREQIACIYLGALFEISSIGIIVKSLSDIWGPSPGETGASSSYALVGLAVVATLACSLLTIIKCHLYKVLRDKSILLDVINTLISTVFALSIVMSQALIDIDPAFWYLDPVLSIVLAIFMMGFGVKVIHQNFNVLKPANHPSSFHEDSRSSSPPAPLLLASKSGQNQEQVRRWKTNYSTISFQ